MTYTFESLSPVDFEDLSRDLLQKELDLHLESFKSGRDKGIDLRHSRDPDGSLIVQCKHWRRSGLSSLKNHLKNKELFKIRDLNPKRYILVTSVDLSPHDKDDISSLLSPYVHSPQDVLGSGDVNGLLAKHSDIERRHFKLWLASTEALDRFFDRATWFRSAALIDRVKTRMRLYANNPSFERALAVLEKHHICIIAGAPGIGKTTLADVLMIHHLDQGFEIVEVSNDIEEANAVLRGAESQLFFYYDDFLGTAFDAELPKNEDGRLLDFLRRIDGQPNKRIVLTTREYILNAASLRYEKLATGLHVDKKCIVSLADYTNRVRAQILYNHVYFSGLSRNSRSALVHDGNYMKVIEHANFSPRLIEHSVEFAEKQRIHGHAFPNFFLEVLNNPRRLWDHAYQNQLPQRAQSVLLALLFMPRGPYIEDLHKAANAISVRRAGDKISRVEMRKQLKILDGSFVCIEKAEARSSSRRVMFDTPALSDYLLSLVDDENDLVQDLLVSSMYFEQLANLSRAAAIIEKDAYRFPGLRNALARHSALLTEQLATHLETATIVPRGVFPYGRYKYVGQPSLDSRVRSICQFSKSLNINNLTNFADKLIEEAVARWKNRDGDRSAVALLISEHSALSLSLGDLRDWALEDLNDADDFALAVTLVASNDPDVLSSEDVMSAYDEFVSVQEDYIKYEADTADEALGVKDEVETLGHQLGLRPNWDEESIDHKIYDMERPDDDDFDYERSRGAHRMAPERFQSSREEIDNLFSTLVQEDNETS